MPSMRLHRGTSKSAISARLSYVAPVTGTLQYLRLKMNPGCQPAQPSMNTGVPLAQ